MDRDKALEMNKKGWDHIADNWFGSTSLPTYAPLMPTEEELNLLGEIKNKKVLDIGCGSGHSLAFMGDKGASELWGLDISISQIDNARQYLNKKKYSSKLFRSPMEENPGIPQGYFDIVYSIYAFGWTIDLKKSIELVASYLKPGGIFVFSWDHPITPCIESKEGKLYLSKSYHNEGLDDLVKGNQHMKLRRWKLSSYVNTLRECGMIIDQIVEDVREGIAGKEHETSDKYYSEHKASYIPLSFIVKAIKE